jgi:pimeloyl-ACP methyl ester carboxylesterase
VFVHGIPGDYEEWYDVPPLLAQAHPAAMFMFRWVPYEERDAIVEQLAAGVSRLAECFAGHARPIILLAHSAGGIIASYAASLIAVPAGTPLPYVHVITVAAPLAGILGRPGSEDGTSAGPFIMEMGTSYTPYSRPSYGVQVAHLRTSYPADVHMKPDNGHLPNDREIGVVGARQIDLPADVTHDKSVWFAARKIADGSWHRWFAEPQESGAE